MLRAAGGGVLNAQTRVLDALCAVLRPAGGGVLSAQTRVLGAPRCRDR